MKVRYFATCDRPEKRADVRAILAKFPQISVVGDVDDVETVHDDLQPGVEFALKEEDFERTIDPLLDELFIAGFGLEQEEDEQ